MILVLLKSLLHAAAIFTVTFYLMWLLGKWVRGTPDFYIGGKENPYMLRWYLTPWSAAYRKREWTELNFLQRTIRKLPNLYLHKFLKDDEDRALHDHPWASASIILTTGYIEHTPDGKYKRKSGRVYFRKATASHRVELYRGSWCYGCCCFHNIGYDTEGTVPVPAWTLFATWFKVRDWGFHCPKGFVPWQVFCDTNDHGKVGKGCD